MDPVKTEIVNNTSKHNIAPKLNSASNKLNNPIEEIKRAIVVTTLVKPFNP